VVIQFGLTPRQKQVLDYVARYTAEKGFSPSYSEIMAACGWKSKSNVSRVVDALVARGHLNKLQGARRCLLAA
jgi:repressor LexA